jgi:pimeloyl-ACP methyl ester carboxylesterase
MPDLINDANGLHEALGGDGDAVIIAHDWGALVAWGAPVHAPERWRKVVIANIPPLKVYGQVLVTPAAIDRVSHFWFFQMAIADAIVAADDFAFIDYLWSNWSPGYDASKDVPRVKDCLRDPANLSAALGYYRALFDPARFGSEQGMAEQGAAWGPSPPSPPSICTAPRTAPTLSTTPTSPRLAAYWPRDRKPPGWKAPAISCSWRNPPK